MDNESLPSVPRGLDRDLASFLNKMRTLVLKNSDAIRNYEKLSVRTKDIHDRSITTDKIYNHAVTTEKIADGAITRAKLADDVFNSGE